MRFVLTLPFLVCAVASAAQTRSLDSLLVPMAEMVPSPEEIAAVETALDQLEAASLRPIPCPAPGETTPLSEAEQRDYAERLGSGASRLGVGAVRAPALPALGTRAALEQDATALSTCFAMDPTVDEAFRVLQFWAMLGWNLEFSALAVEVGAYVPVVMVMVGIASGYFSGDFDRSYLYVRPEVAYPIAFSALLYATIAAGVQAQRQSANGVSSWEIGPALAARLVYLAGSFHPLVQIAVAYLYDTPILTPSVGVSYALR